MAGRVSFNIAFTLSGGEAIPEIAARVADFRPAFDVIVEKWARGNKDKFNKSVGMESSGAAVDPTVFWKALKESTMRAKRRKGQGDQIMVATGDLRQAMIDPDNFFHEATPDKVVFGTPMALEDEIKIRYNWENRQVIFLGNDDMRMIQETVSSYLSLGPNFKSIRFAQGMKAVQDRRDEIRMDMEFGDKVQGV